MNKKNIFAGLAIFFLAMAGPVFSAEPGALVEPQQENDPALARVDQMAEFLSQAKAFSFNAEIGFDAVQKSGQKIEFGESRKILLNRPNQLRVEEIKSNGKKTQLTFNGQDIAFFIEKEKVYAAEPKPGSVDEMIRYFTEDLGMRLPLAEMLSYTLPATLADKVREAGVVEETTLGGVLCDHLALRGDEADMQLWIAKNGEPLPQRIVITYKSRPGQPQFWANLSQWNLAPEVSDAMFIFAPTQEVRKIAFAPKQETPSEVTKSSEGV